MAEKIVFVIDVDSRNDDDLMRAQRKVMEVCQELVEDGVRVVGLHMAIRESRERVLQVFER